MLNKHYNSYLNVGEVIKFQFIKLLSIKTCFYWALNVNKYRFCTDPRLNQSGKQHQIDDALKKTRKCLFGDEYSDNCLLRPGVNRSQGKW